MNDREPNSRSLVVRHPGWLCAGVAAATGLYCLYGPNAALSAAGTPPSVTPSGFSEDEGDETATRVSPNQGPESAEEERVQRALFESDPEIPEESAIRKMALWPAKPKKPAAATTAKSSGLFKLWGAQDEVKDPFAEADAAAQAKVLSRNPPGSAPAIGGTGFSKSSPSRQRLLEYQTDAKVTDISKPVSKSPSQTQTVSKPPASQPASRTAPRTAVAKTPVKNPDKKPELESASRPESEAEMRAMFEDEAPIARTSTPPASAPASKQSAPVNEVSQTDNPSDLFGSPAKEKIRQVSEAGEDLAADGVAEEVAEPTPLPAEALKYRAQIGLQRSRDEGERAAGELAESPSEKGASPEVSVVDEAVAVPETSNGLPSPRPELERESSGRAQVDRDTVHSKPASARKKVAATRFEPAMISESEEVPEKASRKKTVSPMTDAVEPLIRPAGRPQLPPVQVVANRSMELPSPEGWSAAVKLNARRAARLAALLEHQPEEKAVAVPIEATKSAHESGNRVAAQSSVYEVEQQGHRAPLNRQPVVLDHIEQEGTVQVLSAAEIPSDVVRDAQHIEESTVESAEPAKIQESHPEPIVVPEFAAHGKSTWLLYLMAAGGVLFGFFGMWSYWLRTSESQ